MRCQLQFSIKRIDSPDDASVPPCVNRLTVAPSIRRHPVFHDFEEILVSLIRGVLGSVVIATFAWQNHAAAERMTKLADRMEALAARTVAAPIAPTVARPALATAPVPTPVKRLELQKAAPVSDERAVAAERRADDVIASGRLTPEDVLELRAELANLSRADAFEIRRRIADAINTDQLVPTQLPFDLP